MIIIEEKDLILYFEESKKTYGKIAKDRIRRTLINQMLSRTNTMFEWKGLPTTIPQHVLEMQLQCRGWTCIIKYQDKLFATFAGIGGARNYNYLPTRAIVSNPYLMLQSKQYRIYYGKDDYSNSIYDNVPYDGDCVVIPNDVLYRGLGDINEMYANELVENKMTRYVTQIVGRMPYIATANDEDAKKDFKNAINKIIDGDIELIYSDDIFNELKTLPFGEDALEQLTNLIESEQYIKASWFNDLGLQANYNMKRESINSNEAQLNQDAIIPFVDNMLAMRKKYCGLVNELFGVNWSVDFSSAWKYTRTTLEQSIDAIDESSELKMGSEDEEKDDFSKSQGGVDGNEEDKDV